MSGIRYITAILFSAACLSSCKPTKKPIEETVVQTLPEVEVAADSEANTAYKGSVTKLSDLVHTKLDVSFDWDKKYLYGKATIRLKPHFHPVEDVWLDARGMEIKAVKLINGKDSIDAAYSYDHDSLNIKLGRAYKNNEEYTVFVNYISKPDELKDLSGGQAITSDKGLYFINADGKTPDKPKEIWTQGETQSNSVWFPTIDVPNQKTTEEINITVANNYKTLSNGLLVKSENHPDGTRTDSWKLDKPHAPYLFMMAIGEFSIVKDTWRGREVNYYVEPEFEKAARKIFGNTPEMIEFFSTVLGVDYAWPKYSQVVARDYVSGAMENTSATLHGNFLQRDERELIDETNEDVISHELFHQWFGDLVTCESWSNIPLNESFATYGEYLWNEHKYGREEADIGLSSDLNGYLREAKSKQVDLIRFHYDQPDELFDRHSYAKGGTILNMLRRYVGEEAFFASLKKYLETNAFKNVEVHQLRLAFEEVTGEDMNWFFNQWFLNKGHAELSISYNWNAANMSQQVTIEQKQNLSTTPLYKLPLDIDIYLANSKRRERVILTEKKQTFEFRCESQPQVVNVDAEKMLTGTKEDNHSQSEWITLYKRGPLYLDRLEALKALSKYENGTEPASVMKSALNDKNRKIREFAITNCNALLLGSDSLAVKNRLMEMAKSDANSGVRTMAIDKLSENFSDQSVIDLAMTLSTDSSFEVMSNAIELIGNKKPEAALTMCKKLESESHRRIRAIVASTYAKFGNDDQFNYMITNFNRPNGSSNYMAVQSLGRYLVRCKNPNNIKTGAAAIANKYSQFDEWYIRLACVQALTTLSESLEDSIKKYSEGGDVIHSAELLPIKNEISDKINELKKNEKDETLLKIYNYKN